MYQLPTAPCLCEDVWIRQTRITECCLLLLEKALLLLLIQIDLLSGISFRAGDTKTYARTSVMVLGFEKACWSNQDMPSSTAAKYCNRCLFLLWKTADFLAGKVDWNCMQFRKGRHLDNTQSQRYSALPGQSARLAVRMLLCMLLTKPRLAA